MEDLLEAFKNLDYSQILTLILTFGVFLLNQLILWLKTKKSALQKKLIALQNGTLTEVTLDVLSEFYILTPDNVLLDPKDIKWISKDSVSAGDYLSYKKGGTLK